MPLLETAPIWCPLVERVEQARISAFIKAVAAEWAVDVTDYDSLYRFSVEAPEQFWLSVWNFCHVIAETRGDTVVRDFHRMPGAVFFPDARLNFAENLLRRRGDDAAIVFWGEQHSRRTLSFDDLYEQVSRLVQAFRDAGVKQGDRVAAYLPNIPEAVVGMLATATLGAMWTSCSPDFGVESVVDRFGQIEPTILLAVDSYVYAGKAHDTVDKLATIVGRLPSVKRVVVVPYVEHGSALKGIPRAVAWSEFVNDWKPGEIAFERFPFNHPLYIVYTSGTTNVPKCIVHGAGGTLIQHLKEHQLHCDIRPGDRVMYFTTCGWVMWNWMVSALASNATLLLYDGSPFYPDARVLFDFADATGMTLFGTSARFIDALRKSDVTPMATHHLSSVRTMTSTGSPLAPESFDFVYTKIKSDIHLASISGGTEIIGCLAAGNPLGPVWRGEIQARPLGMKVEIFDEQGRSIVQEKGELVCTAPFPSMPLQFWDDPNGTRYRAAYFERFPGVWAHGDFAELTEHGGIVIYGRSDGVLKPGGVRIGAAEIYRRVEQLDFVVESLVIGQRWENDERIILFVRLRDGLTLDGALIDAIKAEIRRNASPRHVPAKVLQVFDMPRTRNGKLAELAVRDIVHGREARNKDALANPESLEEYRDLPALQG